MGSTEGFSLFGSPLVEGNKSIKKARDAAKKERDAARNERDAARNERDAAKKEAKIKEATIKKMQKLNNKSDGILLKILKKTGEPSE